MAIRSGPLTLISGATGLTFGPTIHLTAWQSFRLRHFLSRVGMTPLLPGPTLPEIA